MLKGFTQTSNTPGEEAIIWCTSYSSPYCRPTALTGDGTIIDSTRADEECEGATEVVLRGSCVRYVNRVFT